MWSAINGKSGSKWGRIFALAVAAGIGGMAAAPAQAGGRDERRHDRDERRSDRHHHDRHDHNDRRGDGGVRVDIDINTGRTRVLDRRWHAPRYEERRVRVWVEPVYRTVCEKVWVEPIFKAVPDRVWCEPVVKQECERVWVPDQFEYRTCTRRDHHGRLVRVRERVLVERGHFEERRREVVVEPGHWKTVERQELVFEGHWRNVDRQELVCAGHYEWRTERVKVADGGWRDDTVIGFGF